MKINEQICTDIANDAASAILEDLKDRGLDLTKLSPSFDWQVHLTDLVYDTIEKRR